MLLCTIGERSGVRGVVGSAGTRGVEVGAMVLVTMGEETREV